MEIQKNTFYAGLSIIVTGLLIGLLIWTKPEKQPELRKPVPARVQVTTVTGMNFSPRETLMGRLRSARTTSLHFEITGQVKARAAEPGKKVEAGQILMHLEDSDYHDAMLDAEAQLQIEKESVKRDRALLVLSERNRQLQQKEVTRLQKLVQDSMVSRSRLDEGRQRLLQLESEEARLRYSVESADARLKLRQTSLERAKRNYERSTLKAPFAGVVNNVFIQEGDYVTPSQAVLELVDISALELYLEVRSDIAALVKIGDLVTVKIKDKRTQGEVIALQREPNQSTFTYSLRVSLPADAGLPGDLAVADFELPSLQQQIAIPASAIVHDDGLAYVLKVENDSLKRVQVELGKRVKEWQIIQSGLSQGDRVVRQDVAALSDGQSIIVEQEKAQGVHDPDAVKSGG
jgi:RND family efflux transporter MFP subunit